MTNFLLAVALLLGPTVGFAQQLRCNSENTMCTIRNPRLTIGDQVAILNQDDEIVATGEVVKMRGRKRVVKIDQRSAPILRGYRLVRVDFEDGESTAYRRYSKPLTMGFGGNLGFGNLTVGDGAPALSLTGFGQYRKWRNTHLLGAATFFRAQGDVSKADSVINIRTETLTVMGLGLTGGGSYTLFPKGRFSPRAEGHLGLMYIDGNVGGSGAAIHDAGYRTGLTNGLVPYLYAKLGALLNFSTYHFEVAGSYQLIKSASATFIHLGFIKDIK